tara:strand:+ start:45 stop:677 length:633 start_codon:yes stop_codon:yes gene_type:complete
MKNLKNDIVHTSKKTLDQGLNCGSEGNVSVRKKDTIFITPSGIETATLNETLISEVDIHGNVKNNKKPSSEILMHLYIYRNRPEISAIVHCHSMWASILSCSRKKIPSFHYMVAEFGGNDIKCAEYATFGTRKLAKNVLKVLKERNGCLISNHGQLTIANNLNNALDLAVSLEKLSKQYYFCSFLKSTKILSSKEMQKVLGLFKNYKIKH